MKFPEHLRIKRPAQHPFATNPGDPYGCFIAPPGALLPAGLKMIASNGFDGEKDTGWEHVSVSHVSDMTVPTWAEMKLVAGLFWEDSACLVQYRPPAADYIDLHPGVLHWWRWKQGEFPMPPKECV